MSQGIEIRIDQFAWTKEYQELSKAFDLLLWETKRDALDVLMDQARLFCIDLVHVTQPWGRGTDSKKKGEAAVTRDIRRAYLTDEDIYFLIAGDSDRIAKYFYYLIKNRKLKRAREVAREYGIDISQAFDNGKHHQKVRNSRGRVTQNRRFKDDAYASPAKLKRYTNKVKKRVGLAKSGWAAAAEDLKREGLKSGMRKVPRWVSRHKAGKRSGSAKISKQKGLDTVLLANHVPHIRHNIDSYAVRQALASRHKAIIKLLRQVMKINGKKFSKRLVST